MDRVPSSSSQALVNGIQATSGCENTQGCGLQLDLWGCGVIFFPGRCGTSCLAGDRDVPSCQKQSLVLTSSGLQTSSFRWDSGWDLALVVHIDDLWQSRDEVIDPFFASWSLSVFWYHQPQYPSGLVPGIRDKGIILHGSFPFSGAGFSQPWLRVAVAS